MSHRTPYSEKQPRISGFALQKEQFDCLVEPWCFEDNCFDLFLRFIVKLQKPSNDCDPVVVSMIMWPCGELNLTIWCSFSCIFCDCFQKDIVIMMAKRNYALNIWESWLENSHKISYIKFNLVTGNIWMNLIQNRTQTLIHQWWVCWRHTQFA